MPEIEFSIDEQGIGLLIVNRPEVRNALNWKAQQARQLERETFVELWDTEERRQHFKQANDKTP